MERITGKNNPKIKELASLQRQKKSRSESGSFCIEGLRICKDALRSAPELIEEIYISESFYESSTYVSEGLDVSLDGFQSEKVRLVDDTLFASVSETVTPQGIIMVVKQPKYELDELLKASQSRGGIKLLLLENIQDPGNLGTMLRTAEAAGMSGIIMNKGTTDIFSPKVTRSTMGSIFRVPFIYVEDIVDTIGRLREKGVEVYAAYLHGGEPYDKVDYPKNSAVLIGNEGNGLTMEAVEAASKRIFIPMAGSVESLNAAIAAALTMFKI